jgi:hypothetical protein
MKVRDVQPNHQECLCLLVDSLARLDRFDPIRRHVKSHRATRPSPRVRYDLRAPVSERRWGPLPEQN